MPLCQHGTEMAECRVICGINFCKHTCAEHEKYETKPGEVMDDAACWAIKRNCLLSDCDCGVFIDPATEAQAKECGRICAADLVRLFSDAKNRGENFRWGKMEGFVVQYALDGWYLSARYGLEEAVKEAAITTWREAELDLFWNEDEEEKAS